ncbi:hypothetical protein B0H14DRAFT_2475366 [Mycena olivaceomarginata]|nr:hypothetical protein B0H14DRAFT_2475366 [Mycena olivaceomarginata]
MHVRDPEKNLSVTPRRTHRKLLKDPARAVIPGRKHRKVLKDTAVWSENIERVFLLGLYAYRDSTLAHEGPRHHRRNVFLVDYLGRLGISRTRIQVASHIRELSKIFVGSAHYPLVAHEGKLCQGFGSPTSPSPVVPLSIDNVNEDDASIEPDQYVVCARCGEQQRNLSESSFEVKLRPQYFCSVVCQYADWKPHEGFWASEDFWNYPDRPLSISNNFECSAALQCQLVLIHSDPDILDHIAPSTDDVVRFHIADRNMSVSFRRVRDMAIMTRDSECIAILAQTLRAAADS